MTDMKDTLDTFSPDECVINFGTTETQKEVVDKIFKPTSLPEAYDIEYPVVKQARKHRKKRTNKKWLKRYGLKMEMRKMKGWHMEVKTDGEIEFIRRTND